MSESRSNRVRVGRRRFVRATGCALVGGFSGCSGLSPALDGESVPARAEAKVSGTWPVQGGGPGRTRSIDGPGLQEQPSTAWSRTVPGDAQGEPVVADSLVWVNTLSTPVTGYEAATGDRYTSLTTGTVGTPAVRTPVVYGQLPSTDPPGPFGSLEVPGGNRRWEHPIDGIAASPTLDEQRVYLPVLDDPGVFAFDASEGALEWEFATVGTPNPVAVSDGRVVLTTAEYLIALGAGDGQRTWDVREFESRPSSPMAASGLTMVAVADRVLVLDETGSQTWTARPFSTQIGSLATTGESLFVGSSEGVASYDLASGDRRWRTTTVSAAASVLATESVVYAANGQSVAAIDRATGDRHWSRSLGEPVVGVTAVPGWLFVLSAPADARRNGQKGQLRAFTGT